MASIHKRPGSPFWHASFRLPDGKWTLRSTRVLLADRDAARAVAGEFQHAVKLALHGHLMESQARDVVRDIMKRANCEETLRTETIREFFERWIAAKDAELAKKTADRYRFVVRAFLESIGDSRAKKPLIALTKTICQGFLNTRIDTGLAPRTAIMDVKILRTALKDALEDGLIAKNPAAGIKLAKKYKATIGKMERAPFTSAEIGMLVDAAVGEWKTLVLTAYFTGLRLRDAVSLKWENINLSTGVLTVTQNKTGAELEVPAHRDLLERLTHLASTDSPEVFIMPGLAKLRSGGKAGLSQGFIDLMAKAGLDLMTSKGSGKRNFSKRTFHALRHSFVSALANQNVAREDRMDLSGHATESAHKVYTHSELERRRNNINLIPSIKG